MDRDTELDIIRRIRAFAAERSSEADADVTRVAIDSYRSTDRFADEREMYRRRWLTVGHESEVGEPGNYVTTTLAGINVLVVRGKDDVVRAFRNVCRHRGTKLADGHGCEKSFTCPYHGWTYGLDGALLGVPHEWGFAGLEKSNHGLVEIASRVDLGIVQIRLDGDALNDRPAYDELANFLSTDAVAFSPRVKTVQANWKIVVDGALEAYHIKKTHTDTIYPMFIDNVSVARRLGDDVFVAMPKRTIEAIDEDDEASWSLREHANIVYYLFPNALVLVLADHAMLLWFEAEKVDRTRIHSMMLVPPGGERDRYWQANEELFQATLDEDYAIAESIQSGLWSDANDHVTLGRFERGIRLFHEVLGEAVTNSSQQVYENSLHRGSS